MRLELSVNNFYFLLNWHRFTVLASQQLTTVNEVPAILSRLHASLIGSQ